MELSHFYSLTHSHPLIFKKGESQFFCDISVQLKGCLSGLSAQNLSTGNRYRCSNPSCIYAICEKCYKYYKCEKNEMPNDLPPFYSQFHPHVLLENIGKSWSCDGKKIDQGFEIDHLDGKNCKRYSCRNCDFDLCPKCFYASLDLNEHVNKILVNRKEKEKKTPIQELFLEHTNQALLIKNEDNLDTLKRKINDLEVENKQLREELQDIKMLLVEIKDELNDFKSDLNKEFKDILMKYAGDSMNSLGFGVSTFGDIMTIIPGIGQITGALRFLYNAFTNGKNAVQNKKKIDQVKKTLAKLDKLTEKLNSIY